MGINYLRYNEKNSSDFNVFISGESTYSTPARDIETIVVPGRNGTLSISNNRFNNVQITYPAFIVTEFSKNFAAMKAWLNSSTGYSMLTDTYDLEHFRLARYSAELDPKMDQFNRHGTFEIYFDCDPRRFLKRGNKPVSVSSGASLKNPTLYDSNPLIDVVGSGTIGINGVSVAVSASGETIIDCETQEAYYGSTSRNSDITLTNGVFPKMIPGTNTITYSGFTSVKITPRWWTI